MKLREVSRLFACPAPEGEEGEIEITKIVTSSADADRNSVFYAKDGKHHLAKDTVKDAIANGCRAILTNSSTVLDCDTCMLRSNRAEKMAFALEKHLYSDILSDMHFVFVTGTKGKTTTAQLLAHILKKQGIPTATCGTLGFDFQEFHHDLKNTTPDIFTLLPLFAKGKEMGMLYCVLELSSQALKEGRVDGLRGDYGIFTGISADHIDSCEHKNFSTYREAKRRLFTDFGVTSAFSPRAVSLAPLMTYGVEKQFFIDTKAPSDLTLNVIKMSKSDILYSDGERTDILPLFGEYNLQNASLALLCASKILQSPPHHLFPCLRDFCIAGRGERWTVSGREVMIDYAHNADSIEVLAREVRPFCERRMIALCGVVGDKARSRRRAMATVLETYFDVIVLTEDDTVYEKREDVLLEFYSYFRDKSKVCLLIDRARAIELALDTSRKGDTVLLLGKGHEHFLLREGKSVPLCEREIVENYFLQNTE